MKNTIQRPLVAGALAAALLFASTTVLAEEPPTCEPTVWGWFVGFMDDVFGAVSPVDLGDECGEFSE